jgi:hypothetical protein
VVPLLLVEGLRAHQVQARTWFRCTQAHAPAPFCRHAPKHGQRYAISCATQRHRCPGALIAGGGRRENLREKRRRTLEWPGHHRIGPVTRMLDGCASFRRRIDRTSHLGNTGPPTQTRLTVRHDPARNRSISPPRIPGRPTRSCLMVRRKSIGQATGYTAVLHSHRPLPRSAYRLVSIHFNSPHARYEARLPFHLRHGRI